MARLAIKYIIATSKEISIGNAQKRGESKHDTIKIIIINKTKR